MNNSDQNLATLSDNSHNDRQNETASGVYHHQFSQEIIRKYDIRGIVDKSLFGNDAYAIGLAFAQYLTATGGRTVAVGFDGRHSSKFLEKALVKGLMQGGLNVKRIGLGPTPLLYYAVHHLSTDAGIMVTGSHNAPDYNGFKFTLKDRPFFGKDLKRLAADASIGLHHKNGGSERKVDVFESYLSRLFRAFQGGAPLSVVWDPGNGAAGNVVQELVTLLPGKHCVINGAIDGDFPNHHPDPTVPENLVQLIETVTSGGYDLGVAFDGDGDRIGAVDKNGRIIAADKLLTLFSMDILERHPEATFIADVKTSQTYFDKINGLGGNAVLWNTGHSLIKTKMLETGALLAGEMSGHIFFADRYYGFDDALYAAVRLLSLLSTSDQSLDEHCDALPKSFATPEIRIPCKEAMKKQIMAKISDLAKQSGDHVNMIDGVRVSNDDGWWLIRPSNTEPVLVGRCEAWSQAALSELTLNLKDLVKSQGLDFDSTPLQ